MAEDFSRMKLSELIAFAEKQAEIERETPSLIDADDPTRNASWAAMLEILRMMKEQGIPESLKR